ncbi:MAG: cadherin-like domain-containing protein [Alphaproteobacteria bacterium]|nr:cadherin-like domain-containing protein [Alphaproteobacteria bacterium]
MIPLEITAVGAASHGTPVIASNGAEITFTPTASYTGADSFTYTISDGTGGSDPPSPARPVL